MNMVSLRIGGNGFTSAHSKQEKCEEMEDFVIHLRNLQRRKPRVCGQKEDQNECTYEWELETRNFGRRAEVPTRKRDSYAHGHDRTRQDQPRLF